MNMKIYLISAAVFAGTVLAAGDFRSEFKEIRSVELTPKGVKNPDYAKTFREAATKLRTVKPPEKAAEQKQFTAVRSEAAAALLQKLIRIDYPMAYTEFQKMYSAGLITGRQVSPVYQQLFYAAERNCDRTLWNALWTGFQNLPADQRVNGIAVTALRPFSAEHAEKMFDEFVKKTGVKDAELVMLKAQFVQSRGDYLLTMKTLPELETVNAQLKRPANINWLYQQAAWTAYHKNDFGNAEKLAEKGKNQEILLLLKLRQKNIAALDDALNGWAAKNKSWNDRITAAKFLMEHKGELTSFDAVFADRKFTPPQKLAFVRNGCYLLYQAGLYDLVQKTDAAISRDWFIPVEKRFYEVKFVDLAPATAGAWINSKYYNDWSVMEQRFFPYDDQYQTSARNDEFHLVGVERKPLDDAYRTGVHFLADTLGLHIYIRGNDPKMDEVFEGKRDAGGMECYFKPSYNAAYQMWFCNELPKCVDSFQVDFKAVTENYSLTMDVVKRDAEITRDGVVVHALIPWEYFMNDLPFGKNDLWYFGLQRWCGGSRTLSGHVHELERMLRLHFEFTPEQKTAIMRQICRKAFNTYSAKRKNPNGRILLWRQPDIGDLDFYEKILLPRLNELDKAGMKINTADDAGLQNLLKNYAGQWQNIDLRVDAWRSEYLKDRFLQE